MVHPNYSNRVHAQRFEFALHSVGGQRADGSFLRGKISQMTDRRGGAPAIMGKRWKMRANFYVRERKKTKSSSDHPRASARSLPSSVEFLMSELGGFTVTVVAQRKRGTKTGLHSASNSFAA